MNVKRSIWIISGEASGDVYGAKLAAELRRLAAERGDELTVSGMGGPKMIAAGIDIRVDSTELGVVGVIEVLKHIFTFIGIFFLPGRTGEEGTPRSGGAHRLSGIQPSVCADDVLE